MTKNEKIDTLAEKTHELCVKILVSGTDSEASNALKDIQAELEGRPDYVATLGTYLESPETDDLEAVADEVSEEAVRQLG